MKTESLNVLFPKNKFSKTVDVISLILMGYFFISFIPFFASIGEREERRKTVYEIQVNNLAIKSKIYSGDS